MISNLEEDIDLLLKDKNPTDEEKKIASDIADVIAMLKEQEDKIKQYEKAILKYEDELGILDP